MTLAIWTPRYSKYKGCIRKHYDNETKWLEPWAATWSLKGGIKNGEANLERIERLVRSIKEKDQPFCLANAFPVSWAEFLIHFFLTDIDLGLPVEPEVWTIISSSEEYHSEMN